MTYYQFIQAVEMKVKEVVDPGVSVGLHTAEKMNGVTKQGIILSREGVNISPTIYLEEYFRQYRYGKSIEMIVCDIIRLYREVRFETSWDEEMLHTFETVKDKIIYRVINYEKNEKLLKEVPHVRYQDLAITFYVLLEITQHGTATMLIHNEHLEKWNVSKEMIYERAHINTERLLPYNFQTMSAVIEELTGGETEYDDEILYVLSNSLRSFGAVTFLYENRLEGVGEYLGENFYVLPSSVHEVIIIPESLAPPKDMLSKMVSDINETQVGEEEILSDHAYYYDRKKRKMLL